jgi:hypothetical protein
MVQVNAKNEINLMLEPSIVKIQQVHHAISFEVSKECAPLGINFH